MIRCFFPNCVLEEHETGDHKFGRPEKPWGTLRLLHSFNPAYRWYIPCDSELSFRTHSAAIALYADMLGFGWTLCLDCAKKFSGFTTETPKLEAPAAPPSPQPETLASSPASVSSAVEVTRTRKVLAFKTKGAANGAIHRTSRTN